VHVATWRDAYAGLLPAGVLDALDVGQRTHRWHGRLTALDAGAFIFVVERRGQVRGFASGGPDRHGGTGGEVYAVYVHPDCQGLGAGRLLLNAAGRFLAGAGFTEASLWVLADNQPARGFYEAQGWHADGTEKPWTPDGGTESLIEVRYVRVLKPGR